MKIVKVKIKRVDKNLPLPEYQTPGAVAFDVYARETTEISPKSIGRVPTNIIVEIPKGYMILLKDRSSTAKKKGIFSILGYIDQDFCGPDDEILIQFYNYKEEAVLIEQGERIGQAVLVPIEIIEWEEVESMEHNSDRGGFGSTGGHKNDK